MIVAAIASLAALAGVGLVHEVHTMNPAQRLTDGEVPHRGRRGERAEVPDVTAQRHDSATLGDR